MIIGIVKRVCHSANIPFLLNTTIFTYVDRKIYDESYCRFLRKKKPQKYKLSQIDSNETA